MKILKYLVIALAALIAIFFLFGLLKPSVNYGHEIKVDKSVEEAWAVSQDPSKYGEWLDGFESIDLISGKQGEVGSKYKVVVDPGDGQEVFEMIETVVSLKENEQVTLHFESEPMTFDQTIYFEGDDKSATIRSESKAKAKGIMMKSMFSMMEVLGGSFTKKEAENFEALKKLINENTTDYFPVIEVLTDEEMEEIPE